MKGKYKHTIPMSPVLKDVEEIKDSFKKHLEKYIKGTENPYLSPFFTSDNGYLFYQLSFDLDGPYVLNDMQELSFVLNEINIQHYFEISPTGMHIFSEKMYNVDISPSEISSYRNNAIAKYKSLDFVSSFRDVPIARFPRISDLKDKFIIPSSDYKTAIFYPISKIETINPTTWDTLYENIIPNVSNKKLSEIMNILFK